VTLFYLGRALFSPLTGLLAAVFLLASPLFWFYGEIALPHTLDMFTVILAAYLLYRIMIGQTRWLWWTVVYLALVGGFRQQTLMFLAPLLLFTCYRLGLVKIVLACVLGAVTMVAWFLPLMVYSNGIQAYLAGSNAYSASFFNTTSLLAGAGLFGLRRNLIKLVSYTLYGGALALIPLLYWLPWLRRPRAWLTNRKFWFLVLWLTPALAFYVAIHMGQQGLVFVFLPVLLLASAEALNRLLCARPALLWGTTAAVVVMSAGVFVFAPTYPLGETGPKLLTYSTLRESDSRLHDQITTVRANFKPENTLLLAANWRHIEYYLPEYQFARFAVGVKYEVDEGQAGSADYVNQPVTAEQLGLVSGKGWQIVVMDVELLTFTNSPLKQVTAANGFQLAYLPLQASDVYWTDGLIFGLRANEQASK
jgi:4-amino-4-deoxy-L-arabinose transferase-like glycosyltransferase